MTITEHENPNPNWLDLVFFFFFLIDNRTFIEKKEDCVHDDEHYGHEKNTESSRAKANS